MLQPVSETFFAARTVMLQECLNSDIHHSFSGLVRLLTLTVFKSYKNTRVVSEWNLLWRVYALRLLLSLNSGLSIHALSQTILSSVIWQDTSPRICCLCVITETWFLETSLVCSTLKLYPWLLAYVLWLKI